MQWPDNLQQRLTHALARYTAARMSTLLHKLQQCVSAYLVHEHRSDTPLEHVVRLIGLLYRANEEGGMLSFTGTRYRRLPLRRLVEDCSKGCLQTIHKTLLTIIETHPQRLHRLLQRPRQPRVVPMARRPPSLEASRTRHVFVLCLPFHGRPSLQAARAAA